MRAYWYRREPNFGDRLTEWLLSRHGVEVSWSHPRRAEFFGVGAIVGQIPEGFGGVVWGSGKIRPSDPAHIDEATVLALRGPLTGECGLYADPGLLCGLYAPELEKRHEVGVISHYIEPLPHDGRRIDVQWPVERVIREAAKCERVVSSSLHGLILADSLGIPNLWVYSDRVVGGGFKFRDYAASFGEWIEPDTWRLAPPEKVAEKQQALEASLVRIERGTSHES